MVAQIEALVSAFESGALSRREFLQGVVVAAAAPAMVGAAAPGGGATASPQPKSQIRAVSLNHVSLAVRDVEASKAFYGRVLGVSEISGQSNGLNLGLGDSFLGLYDIEPKGRINHFCVGVEDFDVEGDAAKLRSLGVKPYIRKDRPELYFSDPDGITVQLSGADYRG